MMIKAIQNFIFFLFIFLTAIQNFNIHLHHSSHFLLIDNMMNDPKKSMCYTSFTTNTTKIGENLISIIHSSFIFQFFAYLYVNIFERLISSDDEY